MSFAEDSSGGVGGVDIAGVGWATESTGGVIPYGGILWHEFSLNCTVLDMPN
jgi:hypothetical protein